MKYAIVIPAKNEEDFIKSTLDSIVKQTHKPVYCLVVDDGSDDRTPEIIKKYALEYSFVHYHRNDGEKKYILGGNVVRVFNVGKEVIDKAGIDYDYIIKLDADVAFEADFLESIDNKIFDGKWGIVSGTPYYIENDSKRYEYSPYWHSHGQFKIYNKACLEEIGGIHKNLGWDCADNIKAIEKGWQTAAFRDVFYLMHRQVGGKSNLRKGRVNHGVGAYQLGYSFLYLLLRAVHDFFKPPVIFGSLYLLKGYFTSLFSKNVKPILTPNQIKILRKLFWSSLFKRFSSNDFILLQKLNTQK